MAKNQKKGLQNIESDAYGKDAIKKTTHGNPPVTSIVQTKLMNSKNETTKRGSRLTMILNSISINNSYAVMLKIFGTKILGREVLNSNCKLLSQLVIAQVDTFWR